MHKKKVHLPKVIARLPIAWSSLTIVKLQILQARLQGSGNIFGFVPVISSERLSMDSVSSTNSQPTVL